MLQSDLARLTAVVFDFDGTLMDSEHVSRSAMAQVLAEDGHAPTPADHAAIVGHAWPHTRAYLADLMGYDEDGLASYRARVAAAFRARLDEVQPFPDALRTLDALRAAGVPIAVCTSSSRQYLDQLLEQRGLADRFAATVARQDTEHHKPLPDPYQLAAERLGAAPESCVAVEDTPAGIAAARAAGMRVVGVDRGLGLDLSAADRVVATIAPEDLVAVVPVA